MFISYRVYEKWPKLLLLPQFYLSPPQQFFLDFALLRETCPSMCCFSKQARTGHPVLLGILLGRRKPLKTMLLHLDCPRFFCRKGSILFPELVAHSRHSANVLTRLEKREKQTREDRGLTPAAQPGASGFPQPTPTTHLRGVSCSPGRGRSREQGPPPRAQSVRRRGECRRGSCLAQLGKHCI